MRRMSAIVAVALMLTWCLAFWPGVAPAEEVGQFAQVVNQVNHLKQGKGPALPAKVKDGVQNQDVVRTAEQSRAMMRFIDDTTMTVGPKSELTIEEYLYDASKGKRQAVVQLFSGVVETVVPRVVSPDKPDFILRTPTATAGIRGTQYTTVVGPNFTLFYVRSGKLRVKTYSPDFDQKSAAMQCIAEGLKKRLPVKDIIDQCLAAGNDPCALIKAAVIQGVNLEELVKAFMNLCLIDPELKEVCTPCVIMRCATEALRAMKEEDVVGGKYALLMSNLAPIVGNLTSANWATIASIVENGLPADMNIPGISPTQAQLAEASLPGPVAELAQIMIAAGYDAAAVQSCQAGLTYTPPALPPVISPVVTPSIPGQPEEKKKEKSPKQ